MSVSLLHKKNVKKDFCISDLTDKTTGNKAIHRNACVLAVLLHALVTRKKAQEGKPAEQQLPSDGTQA